MMLAFTAIEGWPIYVDPGEISLVAPAHEQPPGGVPQPMVIPKTIGTSLILRSGARLVVKGDVATNARAVGDAKGRPVLQS